MERAISEYCLCGVFRVRRRRPARSAARHSSAQMLIVVCKCVYGVGRVVYSPCLRHCPIGKEARVDSSRRRSNTRNRKSLKIRGGRLPPRSISQRDAGVAFTILSA